MNTEWELKEKSTGTMTVTVDGEEWKKAVDKAFRKLGSKAEIKGFRKGQVPAKMLEKIIPERERWIEAVNDNANDWLRAGLDDKKLDPISRPMLDIKDMDADHVAVTYDFAVVPEVEMGNYKGLDYTIGDTEVSDEELNAELDRMRKQYADMEVKDGAAEEGDTVNINYEGFRDGEAFEGGKADNYNLTLGSHSFIPGFEEGLVGVKAGEDKELNLTFPEDYYHEDLRGKSVVFKVHVNEVKHEVLPELDDDFAKDVNAPGVEDVEGLKKLVKDRLSSSKKTKAENDAEEKLIDQLIAAEKVDLPDAMIDNEVEDMVSNRENYFKQQGLTLDMYLKYTGSDMDAFKKSLRPDAERTVRMRLALGKIAELEKLEPTDEDYEKEYKNIADAYQMDVDTVKKLVDKSYITEGIRSQMAMDFVKKNAKGAEEAK